MAKICLHVRVVGRVQGVWFRRFTQQQAEAHGVVGWVRNLADGSVEALLCGEEINVHHVEAWLNQGPELATVAEVIAEPRDWDESYTRFEIRDDEDAGN